MSDPFTQNLHPTPPAPGTGANFYAPPDSLYQNPPYDYESQLPYGQQFSPNQNYQYGSQHDLTQAPRSYPPQTSVPQQDYLIPSSAEGFQQGRSRHGSSAEYYNVNPNEQDQYPPSSHQSYPSDTTQVASTSSNDEGTDRNLGGALIGGASGYFLGHQRDHGFLGAMGVIAITMAIIVIVINTVMATITIIIVTAIIAIIGVIRGTVVIVVATDGYGFLGLLCSCLVPGIFSVYAFKEESLEEDTLSRRCFDA
ncbi:hypothetical protein BBP40_008598 [Aspergillus hancockii]|nr:hypothetical protein BBP40_008598 [Aspergillus hancockii]